jgi:hypothetical protein
MPEYVLDHHAEGERARLALMSQLLDPMHRRYVEQLGIGSSGRVTEVGCGNGSVARWLATTVVPDGRVVAVDLDVSLIEPDFLPVSVAEPPEIRAFWDGWLAWASEQGIGSSKPSWPAARIRRGGRRRSPSRRSERALLGNPPA